MYRQTASLSDLASNIGQLTANDSHVCCDYDYNAKRYYNTGYSKATRVMR